MKISALKDAAIIKMVVFFPTPDTKYIMSVPTPLCNYLSPSRCPTIHFNSRVRTRVYTRLYRLKFQSHTLLLLQISAINGVLCAFTKLSTNS